MQNQFEDLYNIVFLFLRIGKYEMKGEKLTEIALLNHN